MQCMVTLFPKFVEWIQVELSLHLGTERPLSTDTIHSRTKVCRDFFQQDRPRRIGKIFSKPCRGPLAVD